MAPTIEKKKSEPKIPGPTEPIASRAQKNTQNAAVTSRHSRMLDTMRKKFPFTFDGSAASMHDFLPISEGYTIPSKLPKGYPWSSEANDKSEPSTKKAEVTGAGNKQEEEPGSSQLKRDG
ncbi:MAG: hypothetical protein MMC33_004115 [Icmadophila ericetorum]|nr:hypothetical protein [Icmadophila ericetorum]